MGFYNSLSGSKDGPSSPSDLPNPRGIALTIIGAVSCFLSLGFVIIRVLCRTYRMKNDFGLDDAAAIFTWFTCLGVAIAVGIFTHHGAVGLKPSEMQPEWIPQWIQFVSIFNGPYVAGVAGFKTALLLLYYRLFNVNKTYRYFIYVGLFWTIGQGIVNLITQYAGCTPLRKFWLPEVEGHCIDYLAQNESYNALYVAQDFYVALLPLPIVWRLSMTRRAKLHLTFVFAVGIITFGVSLTRMILAIIAQHSDFFEVGFHVAIWSMLEINVGLICGCVPTFKPLVMLFRRRTSSDGSPEDGCLDLKSLSASESTNAMQNEDNDDGASNVQGERGPVAMST